MMNKPTREARCDYCNYRFYSDAFAKEEENYCPACGGTLKITGREAHVLVGDKYQKYQNLKHNIKKYKIRTKLQF
jgi:hypothetical protein